MDSFKDNKIAETMNKMEDVLIKDSEADVEQYKDKMPADVKTHYLDAVILYAEQDRITAEKFLQHLITEIQLESDGPVRAVLYDCPEMKSLTEGKISHLDDVFERSTYVFVLLTKNLVNNAWEAFSRESSLRLSMGSSEKRSRIVPVFTESRSSSPSFKIPMGLNALTGIYYYCNDEFYRKGVARLISDKVHVRVQAEANRKIRQKEWIENYKREMLIIEEKTENLKQWLQSETERLLKEGMIPKSFGTGNVSHVPSLDTQVCSHSTCTQWMNAESPHVANYFQQLLTQSSMQRQSSYTEDQLNIIKQVYNQPKDTEMDTDAVNSRQPSVDLMANGGGTAKQFQEDFVCVRDNVQIYDIERLSPASQTDTKTYAANQSSDVSSPALGELKVFILNKDELIADNVCLSTKVDKNDVADQDTRYTNGVWKEIPLTKMEEKKQQKKIREKIELKEMKEEMQEKNIWEEIQRKKKREEIRQKKREEIRRKKSWKKILQKKRCEEIRRKKRWEEIQRKKRWEEIHLKEMGEEIQLKEMEEEIQLKEMGQEIQLKEMGEEMQLKEMGEEIQLKEMGEEIQLMEMAVEMQLKEKGEEIQLKEIGEEIQLKKIGEEIQLKEMGEEKQQIGEETQMKEMVEEIQLKETGEETRLMEMGEKIQLKEIGEETRLKETQLKIQRKMRQLEDLWKREEMHLVILIAKEVVSLRRKLNMISMTLDSVGLGLREEIERPVLILFQHFERRHSIYPLSWWLNPLCTPDPYLELEMVEPLLDQCQEPDMVEPLLDQCQEPDDYQEVVNQHRYRKPAMSDVQGTVKMYHEGPVRLKHDGYTRVNCVENSANRHRIWLKSLLEICQGFTLDDTIPPTATEEVLDCSAITFDMNVQSEELPEELSERPSVLSLLTHRFEHRFEHSVSHTKNLKDIVSFFEAIVQKDFCDIYQEKGDSYHPKGERKSPDEDFSFRRGSQSYDKTDIGNVWLDHNKGIHFSNFSKKREDIHYFSVCGGNDEGVDARCCKISGNVCRNGSWVSCRDCGSSYDCINANDSLQEEHAMLSPICPFVRSVLAGNFRIISDAGKGDVKWFPFQSKLGKIWIPEVVVFPPHLEEEEKWLRYKKPTVADFQDDHWCSGDVTLCNFCGILIANWKETDDPKKVHVAFCPDCRYIVLTEGKIFARYALQTIQKTIEVSNDSMESFWKLEPIQACLEMDYSKEEIKRALAMYPSLALHDTRCYRDSCSLSSAVSQLICLSASSFVVDQFDVPEPTSWSSETFNLNIKNCGNVSSHLIKFLLKCRDQESICHRQNLKSLTRSQVELKSGSLSGITNQNGEILKISDLQYLQNKHPTCYMDFYLNALFFPFVFYSTLSFNSLVIVKLTDEKAEKLEQCRIGTEDMTTVDEYHVAKYFEQKENKEETVITDAVSQRSSVASKVEAFWTEEQVEPTSSLAEFKEVVAIRQGYRNQHSDGVIDLDEKVRIILPPKVFIADACDSETGRFTDGDDQAEDDMVLYLLPEKLAKLERSLNGEPSISGEEQAENGMVTYQLPEKFARVDINNDHTVSKEDKNTDSSADVDSQAIVTERLAKRNQAKHILKSDTSVKKGKQDKSTLSATAKSENVIDRRSFDVPESVTASLQNRNPENRAKNHFYREVVDLETKQKKGKKRYTSEDSEDAAEKSANGKDHVLAIRHLTWLTRDQLPVPKIDIQIYRVFEPLDTIFKKMAQDETPGPEITMQYELLRLCTLRNYPKDNKPFIIRLAGAGFYYAADGDEVVCYCCGLRRHGWEETDVPFDIHRRISSNCNFLTKNAEVNKPVQPAAGPERNRFAFLEEPEGTTPSRDTSEDVSNECSFAGTPNSSTQRQRRPGNFVRDNGEAQVVTTSSRRMDETIGVNTAKPKHPEYAVKTLRLNSFVGWPDNLGQTAETMADAGFYYAGVGDCVRCFFCGIGLRHWTAEDNPWIEHARWSRQCVYLTQIKGAEFVQLVHMAMQYTSENEAQSTETPGSTGNQLPTQELERILLTDAAQSVLEMGYQPRDIKKAIELVVREHGREGVTSQRIMERILELEEAEESRLETGMQQLQVASGAASRTVTEAQAAPAAVTTTPRLTVTAHSATADNSRETATSANSLVVVSGATNSKELTGASGVTSEKSSDKKEPQKKKSKELSTDKDPKSIKAENEKLKEQTLCKVCLDNTVCIVFLPCGHLVTCAECAPAMRKCPICRALVKGTVKTFLS